MQAQLVSVILLNVDVEVQGNARSRVQCWLQAPYDSVQGRRQNFNSKASTLSRSLGCGTLRIVFLCCWHACFSSPRGTLITSTVQPAQPLTLVTLMLNRSPPVLPFPTLKTSLASKPPKVLTPKVSLRSRQTVPSP